MYLAACTEPKWPNQVGSQSYIYQVCTLNIDLTLWHTELIVCAENVKSWFKSEILAEMIG